jgi:hypothetical protein
MRIGRKRLLDLVEHELEWVLSSLELVETEAERWFYRLNYQLLRDQKGTPKTTMGKPFYLPITVLMNGVALERIGEHERPNLPYRGFPF